MTPRSIGALGAATLLLGGVAAALAGADAYGVALATADTQPGVARLLMVDQPASLAAWWTSAVWLAVAGQSLLLFGLRRHRTNDTRGGYRWWLLVAAVATGLSVNAATHGHEALGALLLSLVGFSPVGGTAFWWLAPATLVVGGVGLLSLLELKESPLAVSFGVAAGLATALGLASDQGMVPSVATANVPWLASPLVAPVAAITAASLVLLSLLCYSRRIVLEAAGSIAPPAAKPTTAADEKPKRAPKPRVATKTAEPEEAPSKRRSRKAAAAVAEPTPTIKPDETTWVSGGDDYRDEYEEGPTRRRLSKAERKRLRKQKARHAA